MDNVGKRTNFESRSLDPCRLIWKVLTPYVFVGVGCFTFTPDNNCLQLLDVQHLTLVRTDYSINNMETLYVHLFDYQC